MTCLLRVVIDSHVNRIPAFEIPHMLGYHENVYRLVSQAIIHSYNQDDRHSYIGNIRVDASFIHSTHLYEDAFVASTDTHSTGNTPPSHP